MILWLCLTAASRADEAGTVRSARSGLWSAAETWQDGHVPAAGARVLIRGGHRVVYDVTSDQAIRSIRIAGQLTFARDRDTRLDVGLILVQAGEETTAESGFDCLAHGDHSSPAAAENAKAEPAEKAALEVGTADAPIPARHTALIRLTYFEGQEKDSFPAIVCCGGRMEFHGAPMSRTWLRLGAPAKKGDTVVTLQEAVEGWRKGDRIILTATTRQNKREKTFKPSTRDDTQTEERTIVSVDGEKLTLDRPLTFTHTAEGDYRGDVANLSRNVVVESADPAKARGHTMYHRNSA
ncbi:MAG: hypothetical protein JWN40_375, partial [Phycisphaerales bacterium]|nr:hypothetical protein [Phycisphaerales bacterium]